MSIHGALLVTLPCYPIILLTSVHTTVQRIAVSIERYATVPLPLITFIIAFNRHPLHRSHYQVLHSIVIGIPIPGSTDFR